MPTPSPTMPAIGIADGETSMAPASTKMPPDARRDRHEGEADRHQGGHHGPERHQQHEQRDQDADAFQR